VLPNSNGKEGLGYWIVGNLYHLVGKPIYQSAKGVVCDLPRRLYNANVHPLETAKGDIRGIVQLPRAWAALPDHRKQDAAVQFLSFGAFGFGASRWLAGKKVAGHLDEAFHYTASEWGQAIKREGLRPGSYATPAGDLGSLQAKLELALPPTRSAPDIRIRIDLEGLRKAGYEIPTPSRVSSTVRGPGGRVYQMPGGGYEVQFPYEIPGDFLEVLPIR